MSEIVDVVNADVQRQRTLDGEKQRRYKWSGKVGFEVYMDGVDLHWEECAISSLQKQVTDSLNEANL